MIVPCACLLGLLLSSQGNGEAATPSTPGPPERPQVTWRVREVVRLQLPPEASLLYHTGTILADGRLVLKYLGDARILLFGEDGSIQNSWTPPAGNGKWERLSYGEFVGSSEQNLFFRMDRIPGLEDRGRTYKLWGRDVQNEPVFTKQNHLDIWATDEGFLAWSSPHVLRLDHEFRPLGVVLGEDELPVEFSNFSGYAAPSGDRVLMLTGWDELRRYTHHSDGKDHSVAFRVHQMSAAGRLLWSMDLPAPIQRHVVAVLPHGQCLLVGRYDEERESPPKNSLHDLHLETGEWTDVFLEEHPDLKWRGVTRRFLDGGHALRVLDPATQELVTFDVPGE